MKCSEEELGEDILEQETELEQEARETTGAESDLEGLIFGFPSTTSANTGTWLFLVADGSY